MTYKKLSYILLSIIQHLFLGAIALYQLVLSPWVGRSCRFHPTCSDYAKEAIVKHGPAKGGWLAAKRICACQPYSKRPPIDPVP